MKVDLERPLPLADLARQARMSKFHFVRVFAEVTGLTPQRFLSALRLARAKELLLTTSSSVSDVAFSVGYESLGSFTRQFTAMVGISPSRLRALSVGTAAGLDAERLLALAPQGTPGDVSVSIEGAPQDALVLVGSFPSALPFGRPANCAIGVGNGRLQVVVAKRETVHLLAVCLDLNALAVVRLVGMADANPLDAERDRPKLVTVKLRSATELDPPLLCYLPLLILERLRAARAL